MSYPVIPAPARFDASGRDEFVFRPGTTVTYADAEVAPVAGRFCSDMARRTGLRLVPVAGGPAPGAASVRIEIAAGDEFSALAPPVGVAPDGDQPTDERHWLSVDGHQVILRATSPAGVARGLTTLTQLLATATDGSAAEIPLPGMRILDGPRFAWRGLCFDVARRFVKPGDVRRVIDLLALYKLNVLHLHLTDDQGWRLPVGWPAGAVQAGGTCYSAGDLRALTAYAADRFVTVVPEVDTPGHASALVRMHPELDTGHNVAEVEFPPGHRHRAGWLDPGLPATFSLVEEVLAGVAEIFPGRYMHIGADEPAGMPSDRYMSYVRHVRDVVRALGRRPLAWQESARAGLGTGDIIQYWFTGTARPASLPPTVRAQLRAALSKSRGDIDIAAAASVPVIVSPLSHCYLDVPYAEPATGPAPDHRQSRLGLPVYAPKTIEESFAWEPAEALGAGRSAQVAGVEAAIWAETITGFEDLSYLLLPRLAGVAHKAWSQPKAADWTEHRDRLARHGRLWRQDDLTYFRSPAVDWAGLAPDAPG